MTTQAESAHDVSTPRAAETNLTSLYREALRLLRPFAPLALVSTAMGIVSGVATASLLATLNRAIHAETTELPKVLGAVAALCVLVLGGETIAAVGNSVVGQRVIANLRREVVERIISAPIAALQKERAHRLLAALSHDVDTISVFTFNVSGFFVSLAITLGCFAYLAVLSVPLFLTVMLALGLGVIVNWYVGRIWLRNYDAVRDAQDELQRGFSAITEGAKELRMNRHRRGRVFRDQLAYPIERIRDHKIVAMRAFWAGRAFGGVLFFAALAVIVALAARFGVERSVISGFALVLLYVRGPIEQVVGELPALGQAQVAFRRVAEMAARLDNPEPHLEILPSTSNASLARIEPIELRGVTYRFDADRECIPGERTDDHLRAAPFTLGPIDLLLNPGETLFITGENGCGKTTLLMLLLGLYEPTGGQVLLGGSEVTSERRDAYRQLFSAVFFDYTLFQDLMLGDHQGDSERAREARAVALESACRYLDQLQLSDKVSIVDGPAPAFSTIDLSAGQRKRLALVQAYLDERPVLVFDEWAAEQDPTFRRVFYTEILPNLKKQGHTLIVISHDDRYFDVADRRITMRAGRIVEERSRARRLADPAAGGVVEGADSW